MDKVYEITILVHYSGVENPEDFMDELKTSVEVEIDQDEILLGDDDGPQIVDSYSVTITDKTR